MGAARLLIVDDEETLLNLLRRYLERQGFQVETCATAETALQLVSKEPGGFALVITDLTLKGMNGAELIEQIRRLQPGLPGLITSGYPHVPAAKGVGFLQKPFLPRMLLDAVEQALKR